MDRWRTKAEGSRDVRWGWNTKNCLLNVAFTDSTWAKPTTSGHNRQDSTVHSLLIIKERIWHHVQVTSLCLFVHMCAVHFQAWWQQMNQSRKVNDWNIFQICLVPFGLIRPVSLWEPQPCLQLPSDSASRSHLERRRGGGKRLLWESQTEKLGQCGKPSTCSPHTRAHTLNSLYACKHEQVWAATFLFIYFFSWC